jgi:hypothetical protein
MQVLYINASDFRWIIVEYVSPIMDDRKPEHEHKLNKVKQSQSKGAVLANRN